MILPMRLGMVLDWNLDSSALMNIARIAFRELGKMMNETKSFTISAIPLNSIGIADMNKHFDCIHIPNMGGYKFPLKDSANYKNLIIGPIGIDEVVHGESVYVSKSLWKKQMPLIQNEVIRWKKNIDKISAVHVTTESEKTEMNEHLGIPLEKITIFPLGVDHDLFTPPDDKNKIRKKILSKFGMADQNYFIHISEVNYARKNTFKMLDAFKEARKKGITQKLIIVGKMHKKAGKKIRELTTHFDKITYTMVDDENPDLISLGYVSKPDLVELIQGSDALVLPSIHEGFGMPLVECMACGVPSITSDKHSPPEVVGDAGLLVNPYNVSDIANKMVEINEGNTLQTLSQRALERSKNYSWKTYIAKIFELYEKHAKFAGDWDFEKQYELAAYRTLPVVCLLFANEKRKIFMQSILRFNYPKIVQWASEYGLNDPQARDFLLPFKGWIEKQSKIYEDMGRLDQEEEKEENKETAELYIINIFLQNKMQNADTHPLMIDAETKKWILAFSKDYFQESVKRKFEQYEELLEAVEDKEAIIKGLEDSVKETKDYLDDATSLKDAVIEGLEDSVKESKEMKEGLNESIKETKDYLDDATSLKDAVIKGLEDSVKESKEMKEGLNESIKETKDYLDDTATSKDDIIKGLENSVKESKQYIDNANVSKSKVMKKLEKSEKTHAAKNDVITKLQISIKQYQEEVDEIKNSPAFRLLKLIDQFTHKSISDKE